MSETKPTDEQQKTMRHGLRCEHVLFEQLLEETDNAADTLKKYPETKQVMTTIVSLGILRDTLRKIGSGKPEDIEAGVNTLKLFEDIET